MTMPVCGLNMWRKIVNVEFDGDGPKLFIKIVYSPGQSTRRKVILKKLIKSLG